MYTIFLYLLSAHSLVFRNAYVCNVTNQQQKKFKCTFVDTAQTPVCTFSQIYMTQ